VSIQAMRLGWTGEHAKYNKYKALRRFRSSNNGHYRTRYID